MVTKTRLSDEQWQTLQALLEANTRRGLPIRSEFPIV